MARYCADGPPCEGRLFSSVWDEVGCIGIAQQQRIARLP